MGNFTIKKGRDIRLKGSAKKQIIEAPFPERVAVQPPDFKKSNLRVNVKVGDHVKAGAVVLSDKDHPEIRIVSPASGVVVEINRGAKRALLSVVIEADPLQEKETFRAYTRQQIDSLTKKDAINLLLQGGLWPVIRQRPFSKIADPQDVPKAVFVHAMNTEPLAPDIDFILRNREEEFQIGLTVLTRLTEGKVHLCAQKGAQSKALTQAAGVEIHYFSGPHPSGNVSTHVHFIDPINKGDLVWYIEAQDVLRVASLFLDGTYPTERTVAVTGEGIHANIYIKTVIGAALSNILNGKFMDRMRYLSGSILTGKDVGKDGYLRYYDSQVTVIPEGGKREFLGWLSPGLQKYTFSRTFISSFLPDREVTLDSDEHGSERAIVLNDIYDSLVPLGIMTYFLIRAVLAGNIEEAEELGILECDEEDFALCTFACPSKADVGGIISEGLAMVEKEG